MQICKSKNGLRRTETRETVEQSAKQNSYRQFNLKKTP